MKNQDHILPQFRHIQERLYIRSMAIAGGDWVGAMAYTQGDGAFIGGAGGRDNNAGLWIKQAVDQMQTGANFGTPSEVRNFVLQSASVPALPERLSLGLGVLNTALPALDSVPIGYEVGQGAPKSMSSASLETLRLPPRKWAAQIVRSVELFRLANSATDRAISQALGNGVNRALDRSFVADLRSAAVSSGQAVASTGNTVAALDNDLRALLAHFDDSAQLAWVTSPTAAAMLAATRGSGGGAAYAGISLAPGATSSLFGIPLFVTSGAVPSGSPSESLIALIDQSRVVYAPDPDGFSLKVARHASVQMDSAPSAGASSLVNLWQSNLVALLVEVQANWGIGNAAVSVVTDLQV